MFCCWQVLGVHVGGGGPPQGWQMPEGLPSGAKQAAPPQQSAFVVHVPQAGEQLLVAQMNGGEPDGFGMHGKPLQQSALETHADPAPTQVAPVQRGTPTLSCRQVVPPFWLQLPAQQSQEALHDVVASLHTSPLGLQPIGRRQMPTGPPPLMSHVTGLPDPPAIPIAPQQSTSAVQRSPTG